RFLGYINPYLVKDSRLYTYCKERGWLIKKADGSVYHIKSTTFDAGMLDLTDPEAVRFIKDVLIKRNMLDLDMSGWMADFGEYLPVDAVLHDGDPKKLHNLWPVLWAKVNREAVEEYGAKDVLFFMRSGYLGVQTYAPILWNGDQHTDTTHDYGMPCVMPASFSLGFSGVPMVHCDIGGFFSFGKLKRDDELFIRWMEMCAFSLLMRSHESIRPWANSQFDAPAVAPHTVRLTNLHVALRPYIDRCIADAQRGIPALRPDFYEAMDYAASHDMYSYFLGSDLFVCPVIERRAKRRQVHLPAGDWIHLWTGIPYAGDRSYTVDAPLGQLPVFYRQDSEFANLFRTVADNK
ncbi:MAG: alpha-glucosidase, partial [Clostridia bacterium]|nr:alpha-glucosidase [Clostridia bacterium]